MNPSNLVINTNIKMEKYSENSENALGNLCRVCLLYNETMISLNSYSENNSKLRLIDMLKNCISTRIVVKLPYPMKICNSCHTELHLCYNFISKCARSESFLESIVKCQYNAQKDNNYEAGKYNKNFEQGVYNTEILIEKSEIKEDANSDEATDIQYLELEIGNNAFDGIDDDDGVIGVDDGSALEITTPGGKIRRRSMRNDSLLEERLHNLYTESHYSLSKKSNTPKKKKYITQKDTVKKISFPCEECKQSFSCQSDLELHSAVHMKGDVWTCTKCDKQFKTKTMLNRHLQRHMTLKRFECDYCKKSFSEFYALRRHTRVHTGEAVEKKFMCTVCNKRFSSRAHLATHSTTQHTDSRPFSCVTCGKSFGSAHLLASHSRVHSDLKPYACQYCDKRFRHDSTRNTHHRTHTGEKPYVCSICGKTFIQNSNLRLHLRSHSGEKPYSCGKCEKNFKSGSALKNHMRTHTGEKPFSCQVCGKRFARMDMTAHMRLHTGERPFPCNVCPKSFVNASRLREHNRIHTGEKPFECATCALTFATKGHLIKHIKTHQVKKRQVKRNYFVVPQVQAPLHYIITNKKQIEPKLDNTDYIQNGNIEIKNVLKVTHEVPLEVTGEIVLQGEKEIYLINSNIDQNGDIYLTSADINECTEVSANVNVVTVNTEDVSPSDTLTKEATLKLYPVETLVQINKTKDN